MLKQMITVSFAIGALALVVTLSSSHVKAEETPEPTPTPIVTPSPTIPTPEVNNPLSGIIGAAQQQPELARAGAAGCLVILIALIVLVILLWLRRKQGTPSAAAPYLELESGGLRLYLTRDTLTLGRGSECDLKVAENLPGADTVSHRHARLQKRETRWVVTDGISDGRPSTNGISVNGKRTLENYLDEGDGIAFGEMKFRFHLPTTVLSSSQGDAR